MLACGSDLSIFLLCCFLFPDEALSTTRFQKTNFPQNFLRVEEPNSARLVYLALERLAPPAGRLQPLVPCPPMQPPPIALGVKMIS